MTTDDDLIDKIERKLRASGESVAQQRMKLMMKQMLQSIAEQNAEDRKKELVQKQNAEEYLKNMALASTKKPGPSNVT